MIISRLLSLAIFCFPISEVILAVFRRASSGNSTTRDRGSIYLLWAAIGVGVAAALLCQKLALGRIPVSPSILNLLGLCLLVVGLGIRWAAILSLGRFFTVNVAIAHDHRLKESGLYRYIRHPSYTGLLLAFLGMGLAFRNWLGLLPLLLPIVAALSRRITVEEQALRAAYGLQYQAYAARSWRLMPWVY